MATEADAYGTVIGVAYKVPRWSSAGGTFDDATNPPLAAVESWIDELTDSLNTMLQDERFSIPVTQARAKRVLDRYVNTEVAKMADGVNGSGKFGPTARSRGGGGRYETSDAKMKAFISANAAGFEALGVTRTSGITQVTSRVVTRVDAYSDDKDATETVGL